MLFANKIMINNGCGIITIAQENQQVFYEKLIKFYETGDNEDLKNWIYDTSIDGTFLMMKNKISYFPLIIGENDIFLH